MIERVIKASFDCWNKNKGLNYTVDDLSSSEREFAERHAIEIIKAIREPTDEMIVAAEKIEPQLECFLPKEQSPSYLVWQSMIDKILE